VPTTIDDDDRDVVLQGFKQLGVIQNTVLDEFRFRKVVEHRVHNSSSIVTQMATGLPHHFDSDAGHRNRGRLLFVATLVASLAKQLAVLLFRHTLAALLNNGTHKTPLPGPTDWSANGQ
jgi:hypothetical protein